eukprot:jgi/Mesvir1/14792/Mv05432-RA.1
MPPKRGCKHKVAVKRRAGKSRRHKVRGGRMSRAVAPHVPNITQAVNSVIEANEMYNRGAGGDDTSLIDPYLLPPALDAPLINPALIRPAVKVASGVWPLVYGVYNHVRHGRPPTANQQLQTMANLGMQSTGVDPSMRAMVTTAMRRLPNTPLVDDWDTYRLIDPVPPLNSRGLPSLTDANYAYNMRHGLRQDGQEKKMSDLGLDELTLISSFLNTDDATSFGSTNRINNMAANNALVAEMSRRQREAQSELPAGHPDLVRADNNLRTAEWRRFNSLLRTPSYHNAPRGG